MMSKRFGLCYIIISCPRCQGLNNIILSSYNIHRSCFVSAGAARLVLFFSTLVCYFSWEIRGLIHLYVSYALCVCVCLARCDRSFNGGVSQPEEVVKVSVHLLPCGTQLLLFLRNRVGDLTSWQLWSCKLTFICKQRGGVAVRALHPTMFRAKTRS